MMAQLQFKSKIVWSILLLGVLITTIRFISHNQAFNFSLGRIRSYFAYQQSWDMGSLSQEETAHLQDILSQPFHYLNAGTRSYVFESEDKKYVIKFFISRRHPVGLKNIFHYEKKEKRWQKVMKMCNAYALAYQEMKEDTGLIYLHLNQTSHLNKTIKLVDKLHRVHFVDLDHTEFVIQERVETLLDRMRRLQKNHDIEGINYSLSQIMKLMEKRYQKGLRDQEKLSPSNFGFIGQRAVQIGLGGLQKGQNDQDVLEMRAKIDEWFDRQRS
ncbi:hypothetical protein [Rhabdochlamydiaceae symbiont of Dictyostelium giganteum]|uniref:hypothetical protein n=1 Tax=Rhabdochlamydiaceae symbiont of Dictyostelium giganteum TaxID=3342349 RepID=UPI00384B16B9